MNKAISILMPLCLLTSIGTVANEKNWYMGASVGKTSFEIDRSDIFDDYSPSFDRTLETEDSGFKVYGGYQINKYFAIEAAYADLGSLSFSQTFRDYNVNYGTINYGSEVVILNERHEETMFSTKGEVSGFMLNAVAQYPITDSIAVFAKLGAFRWDVDASYQEDWAVFDINDGVIASQPRYSYTEISSGSDSGTDAFYGAGLSFQIADFDIRAEYEIYNNDGEEINVTSIGALYRF